MIELRDALVHAWQVPVYVDPDKSLICARMDQMAGFHPTTIQHLLNAALK